MHVSVYGVIFCYTSPDGSVTVERDFPIGRAPESLTVEGGEFSRDYRAERKQIDASVAETTHGFPKKSYALPTWTGHGMKGVSHDSEGHPIIQNRQAERDILKATGGQYTRDHYTPDCGRRR